jgi:hypothetical protein
MCATSAEHVSSLCNDGIFSKITATDLSVSWNACTIHAQYIIDLCTTNAQSCCQICQDRGIAAYLVKQTGRDFRRQKSLVYIQLKGLKKSLPRKQINRQFSEFGPGPLSHFSESKTSTNLSRNSARRSRACRPRKRGWTLFCSCHNEITLHFCGTSACDVLVTVN